VGAVRKPNPQGKGSVPVLRDWATMQPSVIAPKSPAVFLRDYCISSLVLAAQFGFKPVVEKSYYLYARENDWNLSLIAPEEWGQRRPGECLGECRLRPDMTWEIDTSGVYADSTAAQGRARNFVEAFVETVSGNDGIAASLPFYVSNLPYYQRLLATALASSLQGSMPQSSKEVTALLAGAREWLLPGQKG
jgi:Protein of unknown function (DUF2452)